MPDTLLQTKLFVPPLRPNLVPRPHLIDRLNQGLQLGHKLTLVSAPAGFGKTTLVAEWMGSLRPEAATASESRIGWLSLDENDNEPTRFLGYFITALNQAEGIGAAIGEGILAVLQSSQSPPVEDVLIALINEISTISNRIVFVLDDYHLVDSLPIDDTLTFMLEHLPQQMHLVIATRSDPNLPLARHRARGQLTELRAADLPFSSTEVNEFLNQVMALNLSTTDITALESRTEGWIAGLQLTAISMKGRHDVNAFIESFTGSHHYILDYLMEDVLKQQPESIREFLLQTAILERLTGSLCDALTGLENSQAILEILERDNLFIIRLDEERRWYRYHQLFADVLRQRLRQTRPDMEVMLHRQASRWHEQNGFNGEAIEHALCAEDFERTAHLIEEHIDFLWGRGEHSKLQRWLERLPEASLYSRPSVSIFLARYQCNSGQLAAAERTLKATEQALDSSDDRAPQIKPATPAPHTHFDRKKLRGRVAATRAIMCSYQGDVPGIILNAGKAQEYLPKEDVTWRSVTAIVLGNAHGFRGDMAAAYEARFEAMKACEAAGDTYFVMIANLELAITLREQGRLQRTIETCRQQLQFANERGLSQSRAVGWLLAIWGETLAELGALNEAIDKARKGFELTGRSGDLQLHGWSFMCLIRILISSGDLSEAQKTIDRMDRNAQEISLPPWITSQMAAWQVRIWLAQGKVEAASQWMETNGLYPGKESMPANEIGFFSLFNYVVVARVLFAQGRLDETTKLLQHLLKTAEGGERSSSKIAILILQALTFQAGSKINQALSALEQALTLAEPEGFIRIFVDEGPPMARLLYEALNHGTAPDYVRRLLAAFPVVEPDQIDLAISQAQASDLIEQLSERELEVLQLIAEGLSNSEIASRLYLSINTVKVHSRNIYGKLGVHNRTQAVARARALGILLST